MSGLFASGRIVDFILVLMAVETAAVLVFRRRTGRGPEPVEFLLTVLAGACLLLALRGALTGTGGAWIALCLLGALGAHGGYVWKARK
jgi:hypothetical protein